MLAMTNPLSIPPENHAISTKNPSIPPPSLRQMEMENKRSKAGNLVLTAIALTSELPAILSHRRSTTVSLENYPLYSLESRPQSHKRVVNIFIFKSCSFSLYVNDKHLKSVLVERNSPHPKGGVLLFRYNSEEYSRGHGAPGGVQEMEEERKKRLR